MEAAATGLSKRAQNWTHAHHTQAHMNGRMRARRTKLSHTLPHTHTRTHAHNTHTRTQHTHMHQHMHTHYRRLVHYTQVWSETCAVLTKTLQSRPLTSHTDSFPYRSVQWPLVYNVFRPRWTVKYKFFVVLWHYLFCHKSGRLFLPHRIQQNAFYRLSTQCHNFVGTTQFITQQL